MDERHEETKGVRGWLLPSRRSVSWLVYLSEAAGDDEGGGEEEWDAEVHGGLLRTFPQGGYRRGTGGSAGDDDGEGEGGDATVDCGSHDGNLQVGWLLGKDDEGGGVDDDATSTHPVFLDSWFDHVNPYTGMPEPHCVLYVVERSSGEERIKHISAPWSIDAAGGGNVADFVGRRSKLEAAASSSAPSTSLFVRASYARRFRLLEDRDAWTRGAAPAGSLVEDHVPRPGTLVAFDSVALPHEVTAVRRGRRVALAGWFHEATQPLGGGVPR